MEEIENLVPAVDRLLVTVIRAVVRKEGVSGAVIAVELVVLAEPLQFGLGAVDLVGRRVRVLVAEESPSSGQLMPAVRSCGATGWPLVSRDLSSTTTVPPQQSTAPWIRWESLQAAR